MSRDDILATVVKILRNKLRVEHPIDWNTDLLGDLCLDSVNQLALVVELENHFRICFDPGDEEGVTTIADVVALVETALLREGGVS